MKNIFKSYMKSFINAWVETIGSIAFLMIFTMLIFGMLAIPLQLTLKAKSIKAETNMWSQQSEAMGRLNDEFVDKYILNEEGAPNLEFTYESMNFSLAIPETGWIKKETLTEIETYATEAVSERVSIPEDTTEEKLIHQEIVDALIKLTSYYKNYGDEVTIRTFSTETTPERILTVGDIYSEEGKTLLSGLENNVYKFGYNNRSFQNYLKYTLLDQLKEKSEGTFDYEVFVNASFKVSKNAEESYNYALSNATALNGPTERNVNNLVLQSGNLPTTNSEIVISDAFARKQKKGIGDTLMLGFDQAFQGSTQVTALPFTIVGIGLKYSGLAPVNFSTFTDSIDDFARVYVKDTFFSDLNGTYTWNTIFQTDYYRSWLSSGVQFGYWLESFISDNSNNYNLNGLFSGANITPTNSAEKSDLISIWHPGTILYKTPKSHSSIKQLQNLQIITWIYVVIGSILFILGFMFIVFVLKKEINNTRKQIGVFKSLGYKTYELTWVFSVKTFITMFFGITVGYLLSLPFQIDAATKQFNTFVIFDYQTIYANPIFLMILMLIVPLVFAGFSYFIIFRFLSEGALDLLTVGPKKTKSDTIVFVVKILFFPAFVYSFINWVILKILRKWNYGFTFRMQHAFVSVGKGKYAIIMGLFIFSSFLFTLQLRAMPVIQNMLEGVYNIYTKETNHVYDLSTAIAVKAKNNKISEDVRVENYGIQFTNIESQTVEDYIESYTNDELYLTTKNFTNLMSTLSTRRDTSIDSSNWNQKNALIAMLQALNTPLGSSYRPPLPITIPPLAVQEYSILGVTPSQMGGIYLNDIGKLACISPLTLGYESASIPAYAGSCGDIETFKKYLVDSVLSMTGGIGTELIYDDKSSFSLNVEFINLVSTFAKTAEDVNPLISVNNIIFDGSREAFESQIEYYIDGNDHVSNEDSFVKMIDTSYEFGGNIRNVVNFSSVSDAQLAATTEVNEEYLNGIISFRLAKILDLSEGDTFDIILGRETNVKIRVAGINENATISQDIYVDYTTTISKINGEQAFDKENLLFNTLISSKIASEGKIDLADIATSINSFVYKRDTYTMASSKNLPWLSGIMIPIDLNGTDYENIITGITLPTSSNFVMSSAVVTIPIIKTLINQILGKMTSSMLMYIMIDVVLLIILLVVIMNIIISDSINVITVMRSLGYSNKKINWMVMGQYVIGAAVSYIFAFVTSLLAWQLVQYIVWEKFAFLIALPSLPWIPFVSAIILGSILYIGWYAAMLQIKKRPLTLLVS